MYNIMPIDTQNMQSDYTWHNFNTLDKPAINELKSIESAKYTFKNFLIP